MSNSPWQVGEQDTVNAILQRAVAKRPDQNFLQMPDGTLTYAAFDQRSNALARGLQARGVKAGDTVSTVLDNNLDCVLCWFAVNKLGAIWVPVNTAYKGDFLRHLISDSEAAIVIAEQDYVERLQLIEKQLPQVREVYYRGEKPQSEFSNVQLAPLTKLFDADNSALDIDVSPGALSLLIYTGGTTGPSKGCMASHNYICNLARQAIMMNGRQPDDIQWSCLPLFHFNATATTVLASALQAASCYFVHRFSVSQFWESIEESKATIINLLGTMIPLLAMAPESDVMKRCYGQVRFAGGAPFPEELQNTWKERFGVEYAGAPGYGLTEATMLTSLAHGEPQKPGSSGKRNEWFDVRLFDDEHNEVPVGEPGEICARPLQPNIMFQGYWKRPEDTLKVMRDLWMHTGDIGKFDEDGYFYFVDRKKDYLRRGGENISSFEVEAAVNAHPDIKETAVHAVFSELSEDDLKITAVLHDNATLNEEVLFKWLVDRLPYFALPRYIEFRSHLPKSPVGRILKYQLRDEGRTQSTWDREDSDIRFERR